MVSVRKRRKRKAFFKTVSSLKTDSVSGVSPKQDQTEDDFRTGPSLSDGTGIKNFGVDSSLLSNKNIVEQLVTSEKSKTKQLKATIDNMSKAYRHSLKNDAAVVKYLTDNGHNDMALYISNLITKFADDKKTSEDNKNTAEEIRKLTEVNSKIYSVLNSLNRKKTAQDIHINPEKRNPATNSIKKCLDEDSNSGDDDDSNWFDNLGNLLGLRKLFGGKNKGAKNKNKNKNGNDKKTGGNDKKTGGSDKKTGGSDKKTGGKQPGGKSFGNKTKAAGKYAAAATVVSYFGNDILDRLTDDRKANRYADRPTSNYTDDVGSISEQWLKNREDKNRETIENVSAAAAMEGMNTRIPAGTKTPVDKIPVNATVNDIQKIANKSKNAAITAEKRTILKGTLKVLGKAGRAIPIVGNVIMLLDFIDSAVEGYNSAAQILDKDPKKLTTGDKMFAAACKVIENASFNLISADFLANNRKYLRDSPRFIEDLVKKGFLSKHDNGKIFINSRSDIAALDIKLQQDILDYGDLDPESYSWLEKTIAMRMNTLTPEELAEFKAYRNDEDADPDLAASMGSRVNSSGASLGSAPSSSAVYGGEQAYNASKGYTSHSNTNDKSVKGTPLVDPKSIKYEMVNGQMVPVGMYSKAVQPTTLAVKYDSNGKRLANNNGGESQSYASSGTIDDTINSDGTLGDIASEIEAKKIRYFINNGTMGKHTAAADGKEVDGKTLSQGVLDCSGFVQIVYTKYINSLNVDAKLKEKATWLFKSRSQDQLARIENASGVRLSGLQSLISNEREGIVICEIPYDSTSTSKSAINHITTTVKKGSQIYVAQSTWNGHKTGNDGVKLMKFGDYIAEKIRQGKHNKIFISDALKAIEKITGVSSSTKKKDLENDPTLANVDDSVTVATRGSEPTVIRDSLARDNSSNPVDFRALNARMPEGAPSSENSDTPSAKVLEKAAENSEAVVDSSFPYLESFNNSDSKKLYIESVKSINDNISDKDLSSAMLSKEVPADFATNPAKYRIYKDNNVDEQIWPVFALLNPSAKSKLDSITSTTKLVETHKTLYSNKVGRIKLTSVKFDIHEKVRDKEYNQVSRAIYEANVVYRRMLNVVNSNKIQIEQIKIKQQQQPYYNKANTEADNLVIAANQEVIDFTDKKIAEHAENVAKLEAYKAAVKKGDVSPRNFKFSSEAASIEAIKHENPDKLDIINSSLTDYVPTDFQPDKSYTDLAITGYGMDKLKKFETELTQEVISKQSDKTKKAVENATLSIFNNSFINALSPAVVSNYTPGSGNVNNGTIYEVPTYDNSQPEPSAVATANVAKETQTLTTNGISDQNNLNDRVTAMEKYLANSADAVSNSVYIASSGSSGGSPSTDVNSASSSALFNVFNTNNNV